MSKKAAKKKVVYDTKSYTSRTEIPDTVLSALGDIEEKQAKLENRKEISDLEKYLFVADHTLRKDEKESASKKIRLDDGSVVYLIKFNTMTPPPGLEWANGIVVRLYANREVSIIARNFDWKSPIVGNFSSSNEILIKINDTLEKKVTGDMIVYHPCFEGMMITIFEIDDGKNKYIARATKHRLFIDERSKWHKNRKDFRTIWEMGIENLSDVVEDLSEKDIISADRATENISHSFFVTDPDLCSTNINERSIKFISEKIKYPLRNMNRSQVFYTISHRGFESYIPEKLLPELGIRSFSEEYALEILREGFPIIVRYGENFENSRKIFPEEYSTALKLRGNVESVKVRFFELLPSGKDALLQNYLPSIDQKENDPSEWIKELETQIQCELVRNKEGILRPTKFHDFEFAKNPEDATLIERLMSRLKKKPWKGQDENVHAFLCSNKTSSKYAELDEKPFYIDVYNLVLGMFDEKKFAEKYKKVKSSDAELEKYYSDLHKAIVKILFDHEKYEFNKFYSILRDHLNYINPNWVSKEDYSAMEK